MATKQRKVFEGVKVLEMGSGAAGPVTTRYFADQGATVVKVESRVRPDFLRVYPPHKDNQSSNLDAAIFFSLLNPDKLSVSINLQTAKGVDLVKRLVTWADVVRENFSPGTLQKFGLHYDELKKVKPEIIMISGCLQGQYGPHKDYPGFGGQGSALSGFNYWAGWPDREAVGPHATITDYFCPRLVASAIISAMLFKRRTGKGMYLDFSQIESAVVALSYPVLEYTANGRVMPRLGNRSRFAAPHGAFPCKGQDRWVAIAVYTDGEWQRLREVMGNPAWSAAPQFDTVVGRLENVDELEQRMADWTRGYTAEKVMEMCQAAKVYSGVVQDVEDVVKDPQHAARGFYTTLDHSVIGPLPYYNLAFKLSKSPRTIESPSPLLGQHNSLVLKEFLGMTDAEIAALASEGVLS